MANIEISVDVSISDSKGKEQLLFSIQQFNAASTIL